MGKHVAGGGRRTTSARAGTISDVVDPRMAAIGHSREVEDAFKAGRKIEGNWRMVKQTDGGRTQRYIEANFPDGTTTRVYLRQNTVYQSSGRLRVAGGTSYETTVMAYTTPPPAPSGAGAEIIGRQLYSKRSRGESSASDASQRSALDSVAKKIKKTFGVDVTSLDFSY